MLWGRGGRARSPSTHVVGNGICVASTRASVGEIGGRVAACQQAGRQTDEQEDRQADRQDGVEDRGGARIRAWKTVTMDIGNSPKTENSPNSP